MSACAQRALLTKHAATRQLSFVRITTFTTLTTSCKKVRRIVCPKSPLNLVKVYNDVEKD